MRTVYSSPLQCDGRKKWLRLHYSQSFLEQPRRGLLRFLRRSGEPIDHVLPAATFGRARWLGLVPSDVAGFELSFPVESDQNVRVDRVERLTTLAVALAILGRRPLALPGFLLSLFSPQPRKQMLRALSALDFAALSDVRAFAQEHRRRVEAADFDREAASDGGSVIEFIIEEDCRTDRRKLDATLDSLRRQSDRNFCVCVVRDHKHLGLQASVGQDRSVPVTERSHRADSPAASSDLTISNDAAWIAALKPGDILAPEAVLCLRAFCLKMHDIDAVFTDSVVRSSDGRHAYPQAKPDWSPTFFSQHDYIGQLLVFRTTTLRRLQIGSARYPRSLSAEILRRRLGSSLRVGHLRRFLIETDEQHCGVPAAIDPIAPQSTKASIIIPTRDRVDLLRTALDSLNTHTRSDLMEIVVVDNDSQDAACLNYLKALEHLPGVRVVRHPGAFNFSAMINRGAACASGEVLVLLNNDCAALHDGWLPALTDLAMQADIGAVGAKLLYDDGTLQHAGVGVGLGGEAGHRNRRRSADHAGHLDRLKYTHEVSAVTGACLAVERRKFEAVGGFDEAFAVAFNDIDFCLRLGARGWRTLYTPHATLRHSESVSRGSDQHPSRRARWQAEAALFRERWTGTILDDPYMHPSICLWRFDEMLH